MIDNKINIIQDIALLYELSLAVGNSLDIQINCENFCKVLMARKNLSCASIWIQNQKTDHHDLLYIEPLFRKKKEFISKNNYILKRLKNKEAFSVSINDKKINQDVLDLGFSEGSYTFFKLSNLGFLGIHSKVKEKKYSPFELNQLKQVIDKFTMSLEACLTHKKLKETTALKEQTEKDLKDSENMFRSLFEQSPLGIIIGHKEGNLIANQQFADMLGCTVEEFSKLKIEDFSPPDEEVRFNKNLNKLKQGKVDHLHMIKKYSRIDGSLFWGNISIAPLLDNNGKFKTNIAYIEDYTKKHLIEESLKSSEKKLKDAQQIAKIGSYELDIKTGQISWSEEAYRIFKRDPKKPPPSYEEHIKFIHPDDLNLLFSDMEYMKKHKKSRDPAVLRYYTQEGNLIYTKGFAKERIENGEVVQIFGTVQDVTEQKLNEIEREKAEESLKLSEKKLRDAQQIAKIGSYELDMRTGEISWSEETYRIFKRDPKKPPPNLKDYNASIHPDDLHLLYRDIEQMKKNIKQEAPKLLRHYTEEGNLIYTKGFAKAKIENGEIIQVFGTLQDVTEQKLNEIEREKAEESLKLSEKKLRDAQQIAKIGSYELDMKTGEVSWSEETYRIFKRDPSKPPPTYQEHIETIHPDDIPILNRDMAYIQKHKKSKRATTLRFYTDEGSLIYTKGLAKIKRENGEAVKLFGTVQDITEQKLNEIERLKAEESLKRSEKQLKDAQQIAKIGSYEMDIRTGEINWSEETYRIFKRDLSKPAWNYQEYIDTIHPDDLPILFEDMEYIQKYKTSKGPAVLRFYTDEGNLIYTKGYAKAKIENGEVIKLFGTIQDITEQKLNEIEREKLLKAIEEVNKELENFAYIVSHDLKAPLRAITSLSQWLAEDYKSKLDESGQQLLQLLTGRVERMHNFIEGILEYSRIGRQSIKEDNIDFNSLVKSVIETLAPPAHIKIKLKNKLPIFLNERLRMEQLFQNLISNAIKYNNKKKGIIEISYSLSPTHHCFKIKDNGIGIEEKYFEKIFQIFQTLQPRDQFESTGIGLTIVKRIIELNEGNIFLESTLEKGTTVNFTLKR